MASAEDAIGQLRLRFPSLQSLLIRHLANLHATRILNFPHYDLPTLPELYADFDPCATSSPTGVPARYKRISHAALYLLSRTLGRLASSISGGWWCGGRAGTRESGERSAGTQREYFSESTYPRHTRQSVLCAVFVAVCACREKEFKKEDTTFCPIRLYQPSRIAHRRICPRYSHVSEQVLRPLHAIVYAVVLAAAAREGEEMIENTEKMEVDAPAPVLASTTAPTGSTISRLCRPLRRKAQYHPSCFSLAPLQPQPAFLPSASLLFPAHTSSFEPFNTSSMTASASCGYVEGHTETCASQSCTREAC
ncbi:hypothetical protein PENSPDRAFT_694987 [Peniophora sp. CONT]|nr:hypothetical protein PENSPDRAFT_694987 [Peniophora sp. CONT]